jgi:GDSL-like Lipase/Acylhydrolase family
MQQHIALLGDSIFDNRAYTNGAPDVVAHLRALLPPGWKASLIAVDGSTAADLEAQLGKVPADATHIVISVGGNDAILHSDLLDLPVTSTAEALDVFGQRAQAFASAYCAAIDAALRLNRRTTVCTIYNGNLGGNRGWLASVALTVFNNVIFRTAFARGISVIDLGLVCTEPSDYANPIEPSDLGGRKIAEAIRLSLNEEKDGSPHSRVYGSPKETRQGEKDTIVE